jgi:small subunit ribosomal protein S14
MSKKCQIARQQKRVRQSELHKAKRLELKKIIADQSVSPEEKFEAVRKLDELPRDGSRTRSKPRCNITGRSRSYMRQFGISRIKFREMASEGYLPGVRMASW